MRIEVTEPQEGWKQCPRCKREGFRPPWQGYCYDCNREYQQERRDKKVAARTDWVRTQELERWHQQQRTLAESQGIDPDTIELSDPPWWTSPVEG